MSETPRRHVLVRKNPKHNELRPAIESLEGRLLMTAASDVTPPTAAIRTLAALSAAGRTTESIVVLYADSVGLDPVTIGAGNITVTDAAMQPVTVTTTAHPTTTSKRLTITYKAAAPGGVFGAADDGVYTVSINAADPVKDTSGNPVNTASTTFTVKVPLKKTHVAISSSNLNLGTGDSVTLTGRITGLTRGLAPTGDITFFAGSSAIGSVAVNAAGSASLTTAALPNGNIKITASYPGDGNYAGSENLSGLTETVGPPLPLQAQLSVPTSASLTAGLRTKAVASLSLNNAGASNYRQKVTIALYLSTDPTVATGSLRLATVTRHIRVNAGKTIAMRLPLASIPVIEFSGVQPYFLVAAVTDEAGNQSVVNAGTLNITGTTIGLSGQFIKPPATVQPGAKVRTDVLITNTGNNPTEGKIEVVCYLSPDTTFDQNAVQIGIATRIIRLNPGKSTRFRLISVIPPAQAAGTSNLIAQLDVNGVVGGPYAVNAVTVTVS